jgi:hypothetical protein
VATRIDEATGTPRDASCENRVAPPSVSFPWARYLPSLKVGLFRVRHFRNPKWGVSGECHRAAHRGATERDTLPRPYG